jgi:reductive dehalogenase
MTPLELILLALAGLIFLGFAVFAAVSYQEGHRRAARLSAGLAALAGALGAAVLLSPPRAQWALAGLAGGCFAVLGVLFLLPVGRDAPLSPPPKGQVDERTIIFARARLRPGTPAFEAYYREHPEHLAPDTAFRANPGLLSPRAAFYDPALAASPEGSFFLTESLRHAVDGPVAAEQQAGTPEAMARTLKDLAIFHGARAVGICALQPYHVYSHIGRGSGEYAAPVSLDHTFALAFTVEMDHAMVAAAPGMATVMESAREYVEAAKIAVVLAAAIRALGYPARAHIDGNYRVIAPLVARDAGLGEIGRMGLLMTPRLGPRVRLGVVTTCLPLAVDGPAADPSVIDFCTICQKCAQVCPSRAIPLGARDTHPDGTLRWKVDAEKCYTYWTKIGTDCARCMAVCPYAHADSPFHGLIRWGTARSGLFRRAVHWMDNVFYGKKPGPHPAPDWVRAAQGTAKDNGEDQTDLARQD